MKDTLYLIDGTTKEVSPKNGKTYSLDELQEFVGGYIEIITKPDGSQMMVVNEEGKLEGLHYNLNATHVFLGWGYSNDYIAGNALVCDANHIK